MTQNLPPSRPVSSLLTPEARRELEKQFDVGAMDELLASMSPAERQETLTKMGVTQTGEATRDVTFPVHSGDPERQKLIERMWAPYWDHLPSEWLDRTDLPFPGREIARARREACRWEQQHPPEAPDPSFHLSEADRARLRPGFDADALERLLRMILPGQRQEFLQSFQWPERGKPFEELVQLGDPELQAALEEVWAPFWERLPPGELETDTPDRPGKSTRPRTAGGETGPTPGLTVGIAFMCHRLSRRNAH